METASVLILLCYLLQEVTAFCLILVNTAYLKQHGHLVPFGFEEYLNREKLCRITAYALCRSRVSVPASLFSMGATLLLIFSGLLDWYNSWLAGLALPSLIAPVLFFLLLFYAAIVLQLPFDFYSTFKVEERYGFNRLPVAPAPPPLGRRKAQHRRHRRGRQGCQRH